MIQAASEGRLGIDVIKMPRILVEIVAPSTSGTRRSNAILDLRDMTVIDLEGEANNFRSGEPSHICLMAGFMSKVFPIQREGSGILRVVDSESARYKEVRNTARNHKHDFVQLKDGLELYYFELCDLARRLNCQLDRPSQAELELGRSISTISDSGILIASFLHVGHNDIDDIGVVKCVWLG